MMAKKSEAQRTFNVVVVGLSGTEKEKGNAGVGKSCLCNRFVRPVADDYYIEHISVLSQTDFSGRVINNDHFLFWGDASKTSEEGIEFQFRVVEQTEFIDDASFQPFKGGKMDPYYKRCTATKLVSAEKLMYICKNQLGIEKEYEQKVLPDGRISVDGFLCCFDVSCVQNRSIDRQVEYTGMLLSNLLKTRKPVVLVTTKNDDYNDLYIKEAERLVARKEFKGNIPIVETSAHEDVNVELAFITLAQLIDRTRGRLRVVPYHEAARQQKDLLDVATEAYQRLVRAQVTDFRTLWSHAKQKLIHHQDYQHYCDVFGVDSAQLLFRKHLKKLKDDHLTRKLQGYIDTLPEVFQEFFPDLQSIAESEWSVVVSKVRAHPDFDRYFVEAPEDLPWTETDLVETTDTRIPFDLLDSTEAETCFRNHLNALQYEQKRMEWKKEWKKLLEETGYVTPGKSLSEVRVLFMGRECFEALSEQEAQEIYDQHQREITEQAKWNFQELLLENADLFYQFKSITPSGTITQEDIKEITDALMEDSRYKALDRLEQDRKLMLFQHLGFVHYPIKEHCPAYPNCMDPLTERILANKIRRPASWSGGTASSGKGTLQSFQWQDNNQLNLILLGSDGLSEELANEIRAQCDEDEYELDGQLYSLDYRIIDGDVSLPQNSFRTPDFTPHGCFCAYSSQSSLEYVKESLEKSLLSDLEQEDGLPFQGLPIVILFAAESEKLSQDGQNLAQSLQCEFQNVCPEVMTTGRRFDASVALKSLVSNIKNRALTHNIIYQTLSDTPDIRIIMCMLCGDPFGIESVLLPLLQHPHCQLSGERSLLLETFLGDSRRTVELIVSSYHGANNYRDELVHGFILVYSTKRRASLAMLSAFSSNIPHLPIQLLAVTESGGASACFSSELCHQLITEGNAIADKLQAHFMTSTSTCQQKTAFYIPFFKEVWEKKAEIEKAFCFEDNGGPGRDDSGEGTLERPTAFLPRPYHIRANSNDGSGGSESVYERLPTDGSLGDELDEPLSSDDSDIYAPLQPIQTINGLEVFPPPATPPEPAPPDLPPRRLVKATTLPDNHHQDNNSDLSESSEMVTVDPGCGWIEEPGFFQRSGWALDGRHHAFTTGRHHKRQPGALVPPTKPKPSKTQTLKQTGKSNMQPFAHMTDAFARLTVGNKQRHAPLATPEDITSEYAQVKDAVSCAYDGEYGYSRLGDSGTSTKSRIRHRRQRDRPSKQKVEYGYGMAPEEESPPRDLNSPLMFGMVTKPREADRNRRKGKERGKEEEKQKKKEEEKQKKMAEKEKKKQHQGKGKMKPPPTFEEFVQSPNQPIPLFLEKCVRFIEAEGLDSEGIYRVPGNRMHVELLFQRFEEDGNVSVEELDIPVNAVATALKDFFSKRLPPLLPMEVMNQLTDVAGINDRSCRLLALRDLINRLPSINFHILKYIFHHFVKVCENCTLNSMDSKNLAICWWPTLLPYEFSDMIMFERMRPHLEDAVTTMIDQYPFLFCGKEEQVMV